MDDRLIQNPAYGLPASIRNMNIIITEKLREHLKNKKKKIISVEVASADHSDIEINEIFIRCVSEDFSEYLRTKKNYREKFTEDGISVLFAPVPMDFDETVEFDLIKHLFINRIIYKGIKL